MAIIKKTGAVLRGEDYLSETAAITLRLESGKEVSFKMADELEIPTDVDELLKQARLAPARIAFWAYQAGRAEAAVRNMERDLFRKESETALTFANWLKKEGERVTDSVVRDRVNYDQTVHTARIELSRAKAVYASIRALKDAMEHRLYVIRKLITPEADQAAR